MIPELGHLALILALALALVQAVFPLAGSMNGNRRWMGMARPLAWGQFTFLILSFACLVQAFLTDDFSVGYVAHNSNTLLPTVYKVSAVWGAHEGSLLLWAMMLGGWGAAVAAFSGNLPMAVLSRVISVQGMISIGFLLFMLLTSNPFDRIFPVPAEGRDLNPLLQDFGLAIHPPMLYMGYVGFSVAFAFAIAALIGGQLDAAWARWSRPWTTVAWVFMTIGIALGSWWAYYELGWGGWWFWDPVENASFMPWLVGTALIHSLAVTEKRGAFKSWTLLLALFAFSLSLLGTFLVRSGVLTSVHAFATDPERGMFILAFLCIVIGGSLALYAWRAPDVSTGGRFESISRESFLLANNLILVLLAILILIGTLAPLIFDALYGEKISVGFPWFNKMFLALTPFLAFFIGIGPMVRWKAEQAEGWVRDAWWLALGAGMVLSLSLAALAAADIVGEYWILIPFVGLVIAIAVTAWWRSALMGRLPKKLAPAFALSIVTGGIGALFASEASLYVGVGLGLATWILLSNITGLRERLTNKRNFRAKLSDLTSHNRSYYGMVLAHLGVAMFIVGATMVSNFGIEEDIRMSPGDEHEAAGFRFRFEGATVEPGPNYQAQKGRFTVFKNDREVTVLEPEKRVYLATRQPMTEAAIDWGFTRDLYVSLGEPLGNGDWSLRVYYKPYVRWIWLGAVLMALGGILAVTDRRYRTARQTAKVPAGATART